MLSVQRSSGAATPSVSPRPLEDAAAAFRRPDIPSPRSCAYWIAFQRASCRGVGARSCLLPVSGLVVAPSLTTFTAAVAAGSVVSRRGAPPAPSPETMRSGHVPQAGPQCPDRTPETGWPPRVRQAPYHLLGAMAPIWSAKLTGVWGGGGSPLRQRNEPFHAAPRAVRGSSRGDARRHPMSVTRKGRPHRAAGRGVE